MQHLRHTQTKVRSTAFFGLPVSAGIRSPFQIGRDTRLTETRTMKALITGFQTAGLSNGAVTQVWDGTGTFIGDFNLPVSFNYSDTIASDYWSDITSGVISQLALNGVTVVASDIVYLEPIIASLTNLGPSSYQTIVSQTGTAAPAVAGGLTPISTYANGTTFTWARTGTGVYTLTASSAVFSTAGKTGVFVGALNNLNASYKTVVTSSTVITITTAIGSLLGLGLLGFTATNTDALLSNTMIYVQTYA